MTYYFKENTSLDSFDVLFRNLFNAKSSFTPMFDTNYKYPMDVSVNNENLKIDMAIVGAAEKDVDITIEGDTLKIKYDSPHKDTELTTDAIAELLATKKAEASDAKNPLDYTNIYKGITRRSFNLAWRIAPKYDLKKLKATMDKGLLTIEIPIAESAKPEKIKIAVGK